ncbi:MAG: response regulator [Myxococcota bacterium]
MAATPRILFVDDEPSVVKNLSLLLRNEPWEVLTATSGAEALSLLREKPCDVVVSDERMPEMSGAEFLSHVYRDFPTRRASSSADRPVSTPRSAPSTTPGSSAS